MQNKRGQGLSTTAIILIILGVIVLAVLVVGFLTGWNFLKSIFPSSENNVADIEKKCSQACSLEETYNFCTYERKIMIDGKEVAKGSCDDFALGGEAYNADYGIDKCNSLDCNPPALG